MSKSLGDKIFGNYYVIPSIIGSICLVAMIQGFLTNNLHVISISSLGLALAPVLVLLKRLINSDDSFNYKKYGLKDEAELKSVCNSWLTDEERNDPAFDICECGSDRQVHGTKYCDCKNFQLLEKFSKRFES